MKLMSFRITNYRSVADSADIDVSRVTALPDRNGSEKTTILKTLASLNPPTDIAELSPVQHFSQNTRPNACTSEPPVVETAWALDDDEWASLKDIWPRVKGSGTVSVGRGHSQERWVTIPANPLFFDSKGIEIDIEKVRRAARAAAAKLQEEPKELPEAYVKPDPRQRKNRRDPSDNPLRESWLASMHEEAVLARDIKLGEAADIDEKAQNSAKDWIIRKLPTFVCLPDHPEIKGHQDAAAFLERKETRQQTHADITFEKMCRVAGLDPAHLQQLVHSDTDGRNQVANRASAVLSQDIQSVWTGRKFTIRFISAGNYLYISVSGAKNY
jgi:hypothetical protein